MDAEMTIPASGAAFPRRPQVDLEGGLSRFDVFYETSQAYRKALKAFYDAGCRYLQFDDTCGPISARR